MTTQTKALKLALEALKKSDGFLYNWHENYSDDEADAYAAARQLNEQAIIAAEKALAQPETPYAVGRRIAKTGGGMSHLWSAVSNDGELAEAERGFKETLAQQCVCGEPNSAGTHRTDGPCLAPQPEQEPVAVLFEDGSIVKYEDLEFVPEKSGQRVQILYTTPPTQQSCSQRQCNVKPLTDEQIDEAWSSATGASIVTDDMRAFARTIYSIKE